MKGKTFSVFVIAAIICLSGGVCLGEIYKYQDASGKWRYTDSPENIPKDTKTLKGAIQSDSEAKDLKKQLYDKFPPRTIVEEATLGTLTVKTPVGSGSGFFITDDGYILTNKHVVKLDEREMENASSQIEKVDKRVDRIAKGFTAEEARLKLMEESLEGLKARADSEKNPSVKAALEEKYYADSAVLESLKKDLKARKEEFLDKKEDYEKGKQDFFSKTSEADQAAKFTVILKDNSEHQAYLVAVSQKADLALLKLKRCKTPCLKPGKTDNITQGEKAYAIGSPIGLNDSVSSGIISGYDGDYIRTDARIYPGNSGGPLIDDKGKVIGINTLKVITYKFEGLGFAIKINTALREFSQLANVRYDE
jgi:S1-C subfamily serine protease